MTPARVPLRTALESPSSKRLYVRGLFATIADRYDLITVLLSFGLDARWKRHLVTSAGKVRDLAALDLACGTGDIAFELARHGARVVGLDITPRMVEIARSKRKAGGPALMVGDMMALPVADQQFDVVTTGYGLRNVPDLRGALRETARVLRPGGLLLSLDFNRPDTALMRGIYLGYLTVVGSLLGYALHRDPDTYRYIPESLRRYPGAGAVAAMMREEGFSTATWEPVLGGLMAIHIARR
jgi:ubiquinone/menaquinone biosynthesis methyltransferase